jgi:hypothetical protein
VAFGIVRYISRYLRKTGKRLKEYTGKETRPAVSYGG